MVQHKESFEDKIAVLKSSIQSLHYIFSLLEDQFDELQNPE